MLTMISSAVLNHTNGLGPSAIRDTAHRQWRLSRGKQAHYRIPPRAPRARLLRHGEVVRLGCWGAQALGQFPLMRHQRLDQVQ